MVNDWATVRVCQAELARCYGVSASTVGWYLAELGDVVVRRRPLVFDLSRLVPAVQSREPAVEFAGLSEAFGRLAAGMNRLAAGSRGQAAVSSGFLEAEEEAEDLSSSAAGFDGWAADSRGGLDQVLAPLAELAGRRGLTGMVHPDGVRAALAGYPLSDIAGAVARIVEDIENGATIRRPFGVLVARAAEGDLSLFRPFEERAKAPVVTLVPRAAVAAGSECPGPDVPVLGVPDVPEELMAELDREASRQVAERFPAVAEKMLANAPLRRALIASLWKERWIRESGGGSGGQARVS